MSNSIFDDDLPNSQDAHTNTENNNNNFYTDNVLENLRDEIKNDENIAIKSAILLKLLEVSKTHLLTYFHLYIIICTFYVVAKNTKIGVLKLPTSML